MAEIIDISLPISEDMPIYPGTARTQIRTVKSGSGSSVLSEITMTSHAGTHIDAPSHSLSGKTTVDGLTLEIFYGKCRVLDLTNSKESIKKADLSSRGIQPNERILFKTSNSNRGFDTFYDNYVYLEPEAAEYLSQIGIKLVGIDALSVKKRGAPDNSSHTLLLEKSIPILEGLNLAKVDPGDYTLCALPLAFKGLDGSPTRAILLKN